jgi:hypothetical protein
MLIKSLMIGAGGTNAVGEIVDLPKEQAEYLIKKGQAEEVKNVVKGGEKMPEVTIGGRKFDRPLEAMTEARVKKIAKELDVFVGNKRKESLIKDIKAKLEGGE